MSFDQTGVIRQRLEHELAVLEGAAAGSAGPERLALETLARVFRGRLADLPHERKALPVRVQDVLPPAHQHVAK